MNTLTKTILLFLLLATPCLAGRKVIDLDPDTVRDVVASVTPGKQAGTGTIEITGGTPFTVDANSTIVIDGAPGTLAQVKPGMQVLSQSVAGTTFGEIDLKTVAPASGSKKKKTADQ